MLQNKLGDKLAIAFSATAEGGATIQVAALPGDT